MSPRATPLPPEQRRAAIIAAARPLLQQHGGNYTTKQVAEAAGIAEGTIFRVFPSKNDLTQAVIDDLMDAGPICARLDAIDRSEPLLERVSTMAELLTSAVTEISTVFMALAQQPSPNSAEPAHHKGHQRHREHAEQLAEAMVRVLEPDADRLRCTPHQAVALIRSACFGAAHPQAGATEATTPRQFAELLLGGIQTKEV